ncbi:MAG: ROK family protein [Planctomycetota bacterium]
MPQESADRSSARTLSVGVDIGGTKMYAVVYDEKFKAVGRARRKTKGHQGAEAGVERVIDTIRDALDDAGRSDAALASVGVGCPGVVDWRRGVILDTPNLGWSELPLAKLLRDRFRCDVRLLNDVDAGVYGEYRDGAAKGAHCAVGVFPGTGIGGGCVYEGTILRGANLTCMEVGHMPLVPNGPLSGAGDRGSLEAVASRLAISAQAAQAAFRGQAPHLLDDAGTDLAEIRSGALRDAIDGGDEIIEEIIHDAAELIGLALSGVINLLLPDVVVLGGGLVEAMPHRFVKPVSAAARKNVLPPFRKTFRVVAAKLGDDATALGAARWAAERVESPEE